MYWRMGGEMFDFGMRKVECGSMSEKIQRNQKIISISGSDKKNP
jgi:hypothetical protein